MSGADPGTYPIGAARAACRCKPFDVIESMDMAKEEGDLDDYR